MSLRTILLELWLRLSTRTVPCTRRRTRPLGSALRVVHHGARLRAGGTIPDVLAWPAGAVRRRTVQRWRGPSSPRRCSPSRPPGRSLNAWPSTPRFRRLCGWEPGRGGPRRGNLLACLQAPSLTAPCRAVYTRRSSTRPCEIIWSVTSRAIRRQLKGARNQRRSRRNRPPRNGGAVVRARASNGPKASRRLERQLRMTLSEMLDDLPRAPDVGVKQGAKGHRESWSGYKLHIGRGRWRHCAQLPPDLGVAA